MGNTQDVEVIAGLSIKAVLVTTIVILLFGIYIGILLYGENSLTVLNQLKAKKQNLTREAVILKSENKKLQKRYFELKQLEQKE